MRGVCELEKRTVIRDDPSEYYDISMFLPMILLLQQCKIGWLGMSVPCMGVYGAFQHFLFTKIAANSNHIGRVVGNLDVLSLTIGKVLGLVYFPTNGFPAVNASQVVIYDMAAE